MAVRIIVADDQPVIRSGVIAMLACDSSFTVIDVVHDGRRAVSTCRHLKPDVLILSLLLPRPSGIAVARTISAESWSPRILMYCSQVDAALVHAALDCGAMGFMHTGIDTHELIAGLHDVLAGRRTLLGLDA